MVPPPVESHPFYKIEIFIPETHVEALLSALAEVGVGVIGNYDHCASLTTVQCTWRPLEGANPYDGEIGEVSRATEIKVEVNSRGDRVREALRVIKRVHPYEEPVINVIALANFQFSE